MPEQRHQRTYDQRLRELVRTTGDLRIATEIGVPRSTAVGWLRAEVLRLRRRVRILGAVVGLVLARVRISGLRLDGLRFPKGEARTALLRVVERARRKPSGDR